jgi:putative thioredoxin
VLADGDAARAVSIFEQIEEIASHSADGLSGHVRALVAAGRLDDAQAILDGADPAIAKDNAVERARAALTLAREVKPVDDLSSIEARVAASPDDLEARFELAKGYVANGDRQAAADQLLESIALDRGWNDGAARAQLLTLFEAVGLEDPWVSAQRRRLSAILFT